MTAKPATSGKRAQFDRLWNSKSRAKRQQFRNEMRMKLQQIGRRLSEENARAYYMGRLKGPEREGPYTTLFRDRRRSDRRPARRPRRRRNAPRRRSR